MGITYAKTYHTQHNKCKLIAYYNTWSISSYMQYNHQCLKHNSHYHSLVAILKTHYELIHEHLAVMT